MAKNSQYENFEVGTLSNFTGLAFLTLLPVVVKSFYIVVDFNVYKFFGGFFLLLGAILYMRCLSLYKKQLIVIGLNFIIFSIFQFFLLQGIAVHFVLAKYFALAFGLCLLIVGAYLDKKEKA